jgi:hypothetical protein
MIGALVLVIVSAVNEQPDNLDGIVAQRADSGASFEGLAQVNPFRLARTADSVLTVAATN